VFDSLLQRLGVRRSERPLVSRLFLVHFALIASYTLARAARDALFLEKLSAQRLPYLYVAIAMWTAVVSLALGRRSGRQQLQQSLMQVLVASGVALAGFAILFHVFKGPVLPVAFYLWTGAYGLILLSLFWALINEAIDAREAKRLFGWIGAGGILGGLAGGGLATIVGGSFGPESMLYLAGGILLLVAPLVLRFRDAGPIRTSGPVADAEPERPLLQDSYVRWIALLFLLAGFTASIIDYQFKVALQTASDGNRMQITRFLGYYYTVLNAGAILLQLLASGWLLRRVGASTTAALLPAGLALGSAVSLFRAAGPLLLASLRLYEAGMRNSLAKSAWEFLFFPLSPGLRRRVKTFVEAVVDRASEAIAGLFILGLGAAGAAGPRELGVVTFGLSLAWLLVNLRLRSAYVQQLSQSLRSLVSIDERPAGPPEAQLLEEAHRLLDSPFERRALYAFDLLESIDPEGLDRRLGALQEHPVGAMRARALARLADPAHPVASPLLGTLVHDESVEVRSEALRLYAARFSDTSEQMEKLLASDDVAARTAAVVYLLAQPGLESDGKGMRRIESLLRDPAPEVRRAVATALGRRPSPSVLHHRLLDLLADPEIEVRREAVTAAGAVGRREFVAPLVPHLAQPLTRDATRLALASYGSRIVGTLGDYLADDTVPMSVRRELPAVLATIGTQAAADELLRAPAPYDAVLLLRLLKAQNKIRSRDPKIEFPRPAVREALRREVELFLQLHLHLVVWRGEPPSRARDLLLESLEERLDAAFARIFRRLGLLYPSQEIFVGYRAVAGSSRRTRAQALEYLEAVLSPEDRRLLLPLVEEPERRLLLAEALYGLRSMDRDRSLDQLVRGSDAWLQAVALYYLGTHRIASFTGTIRDALASAVPLVQETAAWSLQRLEAS
jgi:AAA family ATP:ADP antiporter